MAGTSQVFGGAAPTSSLRIFQIVCLGCASHFQTFYVVFADPEEVDRVGPTPHTTCYLNLFLRRPVMILQVNARSLIKFLVVMHLLAGILMIVFVLQGFLSCP